MAADSHPFRRYLDKRRIPYSQAARELQISSSFLSLILARKRSVTLELAMQIEDFTGGKVKARALARAQAAA